jgi:hypothetical protein
MQQGCLFYLSHLSLLGLHDLASGICPAVQSNTHSGIRNELELDLGIAAWPHAWEQAPNHQCAQPPGTRLVP